MSINSNKIGIMTDRSFLAHNTGSFHPESSGRLQAINDYLVESDIDYTVIPSRDALSRELALVHDPSYVDFILSIDSDDTLMLDPDTPFSPGTKEAALKAAGGVLQSVDFVKSGKIKRAFCAVRPPGHHAEQSKAMGFCVFNNIAIGAAYALNSGRIKKVAIIDWDVHHGNGTQNAFYGSDDVMFISTHQYPFYPGTGSFDEKGTGIGDGFTLNIPMKAGSGDSEFREVFKEIILPAVIEFSPDLIMISAGFDAHKNDPIGGLCLSSEFYGEMTGILISLANQCCDGKIVSVLEGGYSLTALAESIGFHLKELAK